MSPSLQRMVLLCSLAATLLPSGLRAQSIVTLNIDQSPSVVLQPTLTQSATIPNSGNALTVLGPAGANRYYVIGKTANAAVTIYDKTLQTPLATINFSAAPTAAALSPDGSKIVVLAGNVHVIDTTTNADLTAAAGGISAAGTAIDLAMSVDATRAFVLADSTKLGLVATRRVCGIEELAGVLSNRAAEPGQVAELREAGLPVLLPS